MAADEREGGAAAGAGILYPVSACSLYLVRHGETAWNRHNRYQGQSDVPLSEEGRRQAQLLGVRLAAVARAEPFDSLWSSDLRRARETAEVVGEILGLPVRLHPGLREMDFGAWEGLTSAEIEQRFPENLAAYRQDPVHTRPEGGESFAEVQARALATFADILARGGRRVVVVAHGAVLKGWLGAQFGWDPAQRNRMLMGNTGLTVVTLREGRARLLTYNDTAHLEAWDGRPAARGAGRRGAGREGRPGC